MFSGVGLISAVLGIAADARTTGRVVFLAFAVFFLYALVRAIRAGVTFSADAPSRLTYRGLLTRRAWTPGQVTVIDVRGTDGVGCPTVVLPNEKVVRLRGLTGSEAFGQDPQAQFLAMARHPNFKTSLGATAA